MQTQQFTTEIGGRTLTATFSDLVEQANGAVMLSYGNTVVLATVVMTDEPSDKPYFNLTVDYVEKFYASGEILGSRFNRREGRPSEEAILSGRMIDRTIRPLFLPHMDRGVQVVTTVLSADENDPGVLAITAASLALATSDIPWNGPIGAIRLGYTPEAGFSINPPQKREHSEHTEACDMVICGKDGTINMIEAVAHQIPEDVIGEGFDVAVKEIEALERFQKDIVSQIGATKATLDLPTVSDEVKALFEKTIAPDLHEAIFSADSKAGATRLKRQWENALAQAYPDTPPSSVSLDYLDERIDALVHTQAIDEGMRVDGRGLDEVRPLFAQAGGISDTIHGAGIFYRGGTHVLSVLTLGGPEDAHTIDGMEVKEERQFMHHYNFAPYSVGEMGRATFTNRREVGHGALAEKALSVVIPSKEDFPYTIRLVSETMSSNGSTSQASICASSLALMDGGVPITAPVAGIAMGLMYRDTDAYAILTDIQGHEDHHGDMDFKVAGTTEGVTAIQLDVKVAGITPKILQEALAQAKDAREEILATLTDAIAAPREQISTYAPQIISMKVAVDKIGAIIGSGGKVINGIKDETGADISIEDDGMVYITGAHGAAEKAEEKIKEIVHEYNEGDIVEGEVANIVDFGAFVKLNPYTEGLVHISELAPFHVESVAAHLSVGDTVPVKVIKKEADGKIKLSIKEADNTFITKPDS